MVGLLTNPPMEVTKWVAQKIKQNVSTLPFSSFFQNDPTLVLQDLETLT